jgi:hypothetical protein
MIPGNPLAKVVLCILASSVISCGKTDSETRKSPLNAKIADDKIVNLYICSRRHSGWARLPERASAWPLRYRKRHWHGFVDVTDTLKGQLTRLKG